MLSTRSFSSSVELILHFDLPVIKTERLFHAICVKNKFNLRSFLTDTNT